MCGIFGYVGDGADAKLLIEGLKRLEYRGYDSWGVCLGGGPGLHLHREVGRITAAVAEDVTGVKGAAFWGGISHTRWATHGAPTVPNAHPHMDCTGRIAVAHNGIIENHLELKKRLLEQGHGFSSDTDSEVIPHLIEEFLKGSDDFDAAFRSTLRLLTGTYGIAVVWQGDPGRIRVARMGSPMVLGKAKGGTLAASDPAALVAHTRDVIYLEDGESAVLSRDGFTTCTLEGDPVSKAVHPISFSARDIERGGYPTFMLKEIADQPEAIRNALRGRMVRSEGMAKLGGIEADLLHRVQRCHIIACGTSWHAGLVGKYLLENLAHLPTQVSHGSEFRYANPVLEKDTLMIAISQSGETADTLAGVREARIRGADVIGICNVVGSSIARECGRGIYIHAGPEIGVASTKAFTGQLTMLSLLAVYMGRMRGMSLRDGLLYLDALERLPQQTEALLTKREEVRRIALRYAKANNFLYVGRFYEYPVALEGALKLKEISYIHAEGIPAAELKHGPIALVEACVPTVVISAQEGIRDKTMNNAHEIKARGGPIIAVAQEGDTELADLVDEVIFIPRTPDPFVPILDIIPLQLLAYYIATERGCDVDRPRHLAKSVTVE